MFSKQRLPLMFLVLAVLLMVAAGGCSSSKSGSANTDPAAGSSGKAVSGADLMSSAKSSQSAIEAGKSGAKTTTTPPQEIPQGTSKGGTSVQAPQPQGDNYQVWDFDGIDLDGDDVEEAGTAMLDEANTLYVWWSDVSWWSGDELDGFLWIADQSAGFILVLDDAVGLACAEDGDDSGCIGCDDQGDCEVVEYSEAWTGGN